MQNRQIDTKKTKQIRIDTELHRLLKIKAAQDKTTIKALLEGVLSEILSVEKEATPLA